MKLSAFIKPAALLAAGSVAASANAATVIEDDIFATRDGTLINIGGVQTPQFRFTTEDVFGDPSLEFGEKYLLQGNDGISGTRVDPINDFSTDIDGGTITGFSDFGGRSFEQVELRFAIDGTFYQGFADIGGNGDVIERITYDLAAAVPEPAAWAMMILGVGAVGGAIRQSRRRQASPASA